MRRIRRTVMAVLLVISAVCVVFLLNVTAPNPTGRRYSSLVMGLPDDLRQKGQEGEDALSTDLRLLTNNRPPIQCICGANTAPTRQQCTVCFAQIPLSGSAAYRRPDFVTERYILEVKNTIRLAPNTRDHEELTDYAEAARASGRQLWIFTRVNTAVHPIFVDLARSTGGDVIYYLAIAGWHDVTDGRARQGLLLSGVGVCLLAMGERRVRGAIFTRHTPRPPRRTAPETAADSIDRAEQQIKTMRDKLNAKLDRMDELDQTEQL
ncbi:MAG TPA: hypothetical protein PLD47_03865 [Aggregatilineales bacterium]|nr:hypothetical protein [Anaerolineales bacterium]HRE46838.1 hypothetical protein [Aggregatilineales bacterium]